MQQKIQSHENLVVWQKAVALSVAIYTLTDSFPQRETYGISSQMRRAAVSIPSNIAEGRKRGTAKDFAQFLRIAHDSLAELETQLLISQKNKLLRRSNYFIYQKPCSGNQQNVTCYDTETWLADSCGLFSTSY